MSDNTTRKQPKHVTETIAYLRGERGPLIARLDALDLAIDNLARLSSLEPPTPAPSVRRASTPVSRLARGSGAAARVAAGGRRELLLELFRKAPEGLTVPEIKNGSKAMSPKDRGNALQRMKAAGLIVRKGNVWRLAPRSLESGG